MAYDLTAVIRLKDEISKDLRKISRSLENMNRTNKAVSSSTSRVSDSVTSVGESANDARRKMDRLRGTFTAVNNSGRMIIDGNKRMISSFNSIGSSVGGLKGQFVGLAAAIGGAYASKQLFDKTIGAAATYEQSEVTIRAMFRDDKKAQQFMKDMQTLALESPLLNSQDIFSNSKSFISFTKDIDQLGKLFRIAERLAAAVPSEGTEGSVFSLSEMLSGDGQSIVDRFRLPKNAVNEIKKLPIEDQIVKLDELLDKMGFTKQLVKDMGETTLGLWNQIQEKSDVALRTMGQPALVKIRNFLDSINRNMENGDTSGFIKYGQDILSAMADGFISGTKTVGQFVNNLINDPNFIKEEGILNKGYYVFDRLYEGFKRWLSEGGQDKVNNVTGNIIDFIATALEGNSKRIISLGMTMGETLGKGFIAGIGSFIQENWKGIIKTFAFGLRGNIIDNKPNNYNGSITGGVPKRYHGEAYVPRDNKLYSLHKGERILTAQENKDYSQGGRGVNIAKLADSIIVREEADIDRITSQLARKITEAGGLGA